jgi:hypothetical protein
MTRDHRDLQVAAVLLLECRQLLLLPCIIHAMVVMAWPGLDFYTAL